MERRLISSGSPYEPVMRLLARRRAGQHVYVAGTAPVMPDGADPPDDAYGQAQRCLEIIVAALERGRREARARRPHADLRHERRDFDEVARAHGEVFGDDPAGMHRSWSRELLDPRWHVEIEAEARTRPQ